MEANLTQIYIGQKKKYQGIDRFVVDFLLAFFLIHLFCIVEIEQNDRIQFLKIKEFFRNVNQITLCLLCVSLKFFQIQSRNFPFLITSLLEMNIIGFRSQYVIIY